MTEETTLEDILNIKLHELPEYKSYEELKIVYESNYAINGKWLMESSVEYLSDLDNKIKEIRIFNEDVYKARFSLANKVSDFLKKIFGNFSIIRYNKQNLMKDCPAQKVIEELYNTILNDGKSFGHNRQPNVPQFNYWKLPKEEGCGHKTKEAYSLVLLKAEIENNIKSEINHKLAAGKALAEAISYCTEHKLAFPSADPKDIMNTAEEHARNGYYEKWMKENDGESESISCCDDCSIWTVGERRCSCGNRRISACVEGSLSSGFYISVEAY